MSEVSFGSRKSAKHSFMGCRLSDDECSDKEDFELNSDSSLSHGEVLSDHTDELEIEDLENIDDPD